MIATALCLALTAPPALAETGATPDLARLSLEELMDLEVYSVSRREAKVGASAAAVYSITSEEMRRTGVTSLPEALRLAPGMEVCRVDGSQWAITARGFNDVFANKLLVLIDDRTVYSPVFSGVFWDVQDLPLEDVDHIEVIRGPGATMWGANAVNGVINIITRPAADSRGSLVSLVGGTEERALVSLRHGGSAGQGLDYRVYLRSVTRGDLASRTDRPAADGWDLTQAGFRLDWTRDPDQSLMLQGAAHHGAMGHTFRVVESPQAPYFRVYDDDPPAYGGYVLGRWNRNLTGGSSLSLQVSFDQVHRDVSVLHGIVRTLDADLQHRLPFRPGQELLWGLGYRVQDDECTQAFAFAFEPPSRTYTLLSAFAQHEMALAADRLHLTTGMKIEHFDLGGLEVQPSARARWDLSPSQALWLAVSRAARAPSRTDAGFRSVNQVIPPATAGSLPVLVTVGGNPAFRSEEMVAFEAGYRIGVAERLSLDLAAYLHRYDDLRSFELQLPYGAEYQGIPYVAAPLRADNMLTGQSRGVEVAVEHSAHRGWRLRGAYTLAAVSTTRDKGSTYPTAEDWEGASPRHQLSLRSSTDLPGGWEVDLWGRYVSPLPDVGGDRYVDLDARVGWRLSRELEIALVGQNLVAGPHAEYLTPHSPIVNTEARRSAYACLRWRH